MKKIKSNNYFEDIKNNQLRKIQTRNYSKKNELFYKKYEVINKNENNISQLKFQSHKIEEKKNSPLIIPKQLNKNYRNIIPNKSIINDINMNNNNSSSHNIIITELLNKTENFFNKIGYYPSENEKIDLTNFDYHKLRIKKIKINNIKVIDKYKINYDKKDEEVETKNTNNVYNNTIIEEEKNKKKFFNYNINKNNDNNSNSVYKTIIFKRNPKLIDDRSKTINIFKKKNNYFNLSNNRKKTKKSKYKNFLPFLSKSMGNICDKNEIKIAEIRKIYPIHSYKGINNLNITNYNKFNRNYKNNFLINSIINFSVDNTYDYKNIMNNIKYIIRSKNKIFNNK